MVCLYGWAPAYEFPGGNFVDGSPPNVIGRRVGRDKCVKPTFGLFVLVIPLLVCAGVLHGCNHRSWISIPGRSGYAPGMHKHRSRSTCLTAQRATETVVYNWFVCWCVACNGYPWYVWLIWVTQTALRLPLPVTWLTVYHKLQICDGAWRNINVAKIDAGIWMWCLKLIWDTLTWF